MQVSIRFCLIAIIALIAPAVATADFQVFNQINNPGQTYTLSGRTTTLSQYDTTPNLPVGVPPELATTFDDFTLTSTANIDQIQWTGAYDGPGLHATEFRISFYQDNGGAYGAQIGPTLNAAIGSVAETADIGNHFRYTYNPGTPLVFNGGTKYWMSVVAALDYGDNGDPTPTSNSWGWAFNGATPGGTSMQDFSGTIFTDPIDHSFNLTTTVVPEPSTCLLLAGAVSGIAARKWRTRRKSAA